MKSETTEEVCGDSVLVIVAGELLLVREQGRALFPLLKVLEEEDLEQVIARRAGELAPEAVPCFVANIICRECPEPHALSVYGARVDAGGEAPSGWCWLPWEAALARGGTTARQAADALDGVVSRQDATVCVLTQARMRHDEEDLLAASAGRWLLGSPKDHKAPSIEVLALQRGLLISSPGVCLLLAPASYEEAPPASAARMLEDLAALSLYRLAEAAARGSPSLDFYERDPAVFRWELRARLEELGTRAGGPLTREAFKCLAEPLVERLEQEDLLPALRALGLPEAFENGESPLAMGLILTEELAEAKAILDRLCLLLQDDASMFYAEGYSARARVAEELYRGRWRKGFPDDQELLAHHADILAHHASSQEPGVSRWVLRLEGRGGGSVLVLGAQFSEGAWKLNALPVSWWRLHVELYGGASFARMSSAEAEYLRERWQKQKAFPQSARPSARLN